MTYTVLFRSDGLLFLPVASLYFSVCFFDAVKITLLLYPVYLVAQLVDVSRMVTLWKETNEHPVLVCH
ncbi:hypothetical protein AHF37_00936 [Paragonimus kellicotti]|nr:hypothetical protein AHF37_00936 [Paragonimus kellicotti]